MKIMMATNNDADRMEALFAFKRMNLAHSFDFVADANDLLNYLERKTTAHALMPDLLLLDLNLPGEDLELILGVIKSDASLQAIDTVIFSVSDLHYAAPVGKNGTGYDSTLPRPYPDDSAWIFEEICAELVAKDGWRYSCNGKHTDNG